MLDFSELILTNVKLPEGSLSLANDTDADESLLDLSDFPALMEDLMDPDLASTAKSVNQETIELLQSKDEEKESHSETILDLSIQPLLTIEENPQMAWFAASSFLPPEPLPVDSEALDAEESLDIVKGPYDRPESANPFLVLEESNENSNFDFLQQTEIIENSQTIQDNNKSEETAVFSNSAEDQSETATPFSILEALSEEQSSMEKSLLDNEIMMALQQHSSDRVNATESYQDIKGVLGLSSNKDAFINASKEPSLTEISQSIDEPEWSHAFNQQIMWLGQQKISAARIKLNPQEFGPLEINIKMFKENASMDISTQSIQVRELIEQALPQLREMMAEKGIQLTDVTIDANGNQQQDSRDTDKNSVLKSENVEEPIMDDITPLRIRQGLVDYFA